MSLTHTAPEVAPSEVSGGGGSRSELVINWDVSVWATSFPSGYCFSSNYHILLQYTDVDCDDDDDVVVMAVMVVLLLVVVIYSYWWH